MGKTMLVTEEVVRNRKDAITHEEIVAATLAFKQAGGAIDRIEREVPRPSSGVVNHSLEARRR